MKPILTLLCAALTANAAPAEEPPTDHRAWNDEVRQWRAKLDANDPGMTAKWFARGLDDSQWKTMRLPGIHERAGLPGHDGTVWYRRSVKLSAAEAKLAHTLDLGPIDDMDMAWVNGKQVGGIEIPGYWLKPRSYAVPARLLQPGRNVITVRVIDHGWTGGFTGSPAQMSLRGKTSHALSGAWRYHVGVSLKSLGLKSLTNPSRPWTARPTPPVEPDLPAMLHPLAKADRPVPPFEDGFKIDGPQTIAIFGGANAAECQRHGWLELRLQSAFPQHRVRLRNLARPTDTVFEQTRPRNFFGPTKPDYGKKDGRPPIPIDIAVLWFGQMESLRGEQGLAEFKEAYERLVQQLTRFTKRIVLVTPVPFDDPLSLGFDVAARNRNLRKYVGVVRELAGRHKLPLVELPAAKTRDGALLSDAGHEESAAAFARQLGFDRKLPSFAEYLRETIQEKNIIWSRYWLPSNWAFVYGNRQSQPSSRDHRDKSKRWFPQELEDFRKRAEELEVQIHDRVRENR